MDYIDYLTASKLTGLSLGTLYGMVSQKRIPHVRLGRRLIRFKRDELLAWLEEHRVTASAGVKEESRGHVR